MRNFALLTMLMITTAAVSAVGPIETMDPAAAPTSLTTTIRYKFINQSCDILLTDAIIVGEDWLLDTTLAKAAGVNVILQLRPGLGAPDKINPPSPCEAPGGICDTMRPRGTPFTIDLIDDAHMGGGGFQYDPYSGIIAVNSLLFHKPDLYGHGPDRGSLDSTMVAQYDCNEGDTLFFDVVYLTMTGTPPESAACYCGQERFAPGFRGDTHQTWDYGRLSHWEILNSSDDFTDITRASAMTSGCGGIGTVADRCNTDGVETNSPLRGAKPAIRLSAAYPNPFTVATSFRYEVPSAGLVDLSVTDVRGVKVKTLYQGTRPAETYLVTWDGLDDSGQELTNGVYWLELSNGKESARSKVVRLR